MRLQRQRDRPYAMSSIWSVIGFYHHGCRGYFIPPSLSRFLPSSLAYCNVDDAPTLIIIRISRLSIGVLAYGATGRWNTALLRALKRPELGLRPHLSRTMFRANWQYA